ncbi:MAG: hypothetical protein HOE30_27060 [Deltaproteobacteria bacterium]|jgi:hypothetical protein|nr:hypothetical protein [Deltaproteobacteria bacterium]MBT4092165.1 hypothetical protein [Deltaproteobacteria bacterium]MBT4267770.1 hypothetical protein [Deltaproteobacteria bacterium]MBT4644582.1 hypothetical protein [Deltaproteobacteria bacterium]MBT6499841.1 hypothetical protein [Deltaproteobacteria bacterium]
MRKSVKFKPSHDFLSQAVSEYLADGGTITKLEFDERSFKDFIATSESPMAVDEFLNGN